ncbi:MAG: glycosyltransferase family 9 protein [Candidatus Omnitrophica bacterium]|nr:glycosyltransferase family 9 protein [Candidatus Omnitrophota bacterium]
MKPISPYYLFKKKRNILAVSIIDFIGRILFYPLRWIKPPVVIKNVLMIRLDHMGDVVSSTPAFREWKANYPASRLTVLTSAWGRQVLDWNPYIDEFIVMDHHWFRRDRKRWDSAEIKSVLEKLRRGEFDIGFSLRGDFREILLMFLAGVKYRVGYGVTGGGFLLNRELPYENTRHEVENNLRLIKEEGCTLSEVKTEVFVSDENMRQARKILEGGGIDFRKPVICFHMGAAYSSKQWPEERFLEVIRRLIEKRHFSAVLIGTREEETLARALAGNNAVVNLIGKTDIGLLCGVIKSCSLFVGNDSGPSHIAAASGVPVVVIASGTNNYEKWGVWTARKIVLRSIVPCMPCNYQICPKPRHLCMDNVSPDEVYNAIVKSIDQEIGVF